MTRRRDRKALRQRIEAVGAAPSPEPRADRVAATEARLRAIYDAHGGTAPATAPATGVGQSRAAGRGRRRLVGSAMAGVLALGVLVGIALATRSEDGAQNGSLLLTAADRAYIVLPDGTRIPAAAGITVPDGARVVVEAGGSATLDGVTLQPGESATVDGGEVDVRPSGATPDSTSPPPSSSDPGTSRTTDRPATTVEPDPGNEPPTTTTTRPPTTTTAPVPLDQVLELRAWATIDGEVVHLRWQRYTGDDFGAYVVLARYDGLAPLPERPGNVVLFRTTNPAVNTRDVRFRPGMTIRIVAVAADKHIVAGSRVLRPTAEPRINGTGGTPAGSSTTTSTSPATSTTSGATTTTRLD